MGSSMIFFPSTVLTPEGLQGQKRVPTVLGEKTSVSRYQGFTQDS